MLMQYQHSQHFSSQEKWYRLVLYGFASERTAESATITVHVSGGSRGGARGAGAPPLA